MSGPHVDEALRLLDEKERRTQAARDLARAAERDRKEYDMEASRRLAISQLLEHIAKQGNRFIELGWTELGQDILELQHAVLEADQRHLERVKT